MASENKQPKGFAGWIDWYLADPLLNREARLRKQVSFQWFVLAAIAISVLTLFSYFMGVGVLVHYGLWLLLFYLLFFPAFHFLHRYDWANFWFLLIIILITSIYIGICGGISYSGGLIFVGLNCAFSSILMNSIRATVVTFSWYALTIIALGILGPQLSVHPDMNPQINTLFYVINTIWMSAAQMMFIISYIQEKGQIEATEARRLKELDEEKSRFYTNITHEFRTPLTIILGMAEKLPPEDPQALEAARMIKKSGRRLLRLVNQLLGLARLEAGQEDVHWMRTNTQSFLQMLFEPYEIAAKHHGIQWSVRMESAPLQMDLDPDKWEVIFGNILANAIKFTPADGTIEVIVETIPVLPPAKDLPPSAVLRISIRDTGPGIQPERLPLIFNRFYQGEEPESHMQEGSGVGLTLVREYVSLLGGQVSARSTPGSGSTFIVELPISESAVPVSAVQVSEASTAYPEAEAVVSVGKTPRSVVDSLPLVLLVEDNDDVVHYLYLMLQDHYRLQRAHDGKEGLNLARQMIPDLIISDVMMPVMDGLAMLEQLKADQRTSHIPIIVLTAKVDQSSRLAGLEKGAEAYLTKPFSQAELLLRIRKLLQLRRDLQHRYAVFGTSQGKAVDARYALEDQFMTRVRRIFIQHLDDETFGIAALCRELGMSRTQLYRKFSALTDMTVYQYLRRFRLHHAQELLQRGDLNVSQVALEVGITNVSYFSRAFTEEFGINPSQVRSSIRR